MSSGCGHFSCVVPTYYEILWTIIFNGNEADTVRFRVYNEIHTDNGF